MIETSSPIHILLVNDNENERLLFRRAFRQSNVSCEITECADAEQVLELLRLEAQPFDVVAVDYNLTGLSGVDLCRKLLDEKVPLPLMLLAEAGRERHVAEALKAGVHHYIIKDPEQGYLELLPMSLINIVRPFHDCRNYEQTMEMIQYKERAAGAFLESIPDTAGIIDTDGNVLMINKAGAESLGGSVDEIIGRNAREFIFGDVYELRRSKWTQVIQTGKISHFEDERDGRYFETWFCPVFDKKGKVESIAVFAHDITEHKRAEEALRQSEEKFRLAMEVTNDALWDWNMVTNEVYRNPRHALMLGYEPHELSASQEEWEKRIHPDDRQALFQIVEEHIAGKRDSIEVEYRLKTKSGDYVWLLGRGKITAYNDDGSPARMIGTNIDITYRKNLLERDEVMLKTCIDGFWMIDADGHILEVNDAYCRMSGYSRDELLTMSIKDVEVKEEPEEISQHVREIISKGSDRFESRQRRKDGTIMDLDISATYLELDDGRVFTFFRDITAAKKTEQEIRKFKTIADKAVHGVAISDLEGNFLYVNDSFARMHQYNSDELIGKNLSIFHNEEQLEYVKQLNEHIKLKGGFASEEVWHKKRDNTVFPTLMSATLVKDEHEESLFMAATAIDITKHKKAEELLRYSEERYRSVVEDSPVLLCSFLPDGEIVFVNTAYCKYFGKTSKELVGSNFKHLIPEEDRQAVLDNMMSLTADSPTMTHEHTVYAPDGRIRWQRWTNRALFNEHGRAVSFQAFGEDITETKRREEELTIFREQMARAEQLASLGTLSATIAHQLTQPLTVIRLSIDNALDGLEASSSSQTVIRRLKDSVTQVSNITSIIERFRNFARKSSGRTVSEVSLKAVAVRIAGLLSESARSASITLRIRNMDDLPCQWMNENDLEQLFFALIGNSIQAADGKKNRQLVISGAVKEKYIELRFSDDCGGIAPENIDKIFEPFFTTKPRGQGTGLGLCIVEDIVSRIGGHIRVESKFGEGTTFIINIPVEKDKIS